MRKTNQAEVAAAKPTRKESQNNMRLWHYELLSYLPDAQFKGQLRELVLIMRNWRDKGKTNHLLINRVMEYSKHELVTYFLKYEAEYHKRYGKWLMGQWEEFKKFDDKIYPLNCVMFDGWHNKDYLRSNMANLYEKHFFGVGKSKITDKDWQTLCEGYKQITGEEYQI